MKRFFYNEELCGCKNKSCRRILADLNPHQSIVTAKRLIYCILQLGCYLSSLLISISKLMCYFYRIKDTHREKASSDKTPALTKSTNTGILVVGTSNQHFIRGS